ncbi:tyrosine-type recombinase/integrase [Haloplanus halophilus]|uniref:tyrosine-type recombinase/integrase n=1 Tax=Haloplanus halophilus TaxID=2949993 RepID=UPI00203AFC5A|nr:phage integrase SAM-like domain-containing protein [Haloplanus sp. GDY1]
MTPDEEHRATESEAETVSVLDVLEDYLTDKGKGRDGESGQYRRHADREVNRFVEFLAGDQPTSSVTFEELTVEALREYARYLSRQGWTEGTVQNYYAHVSGFCGWAAREGYLSGNPAQRRRAKEPLPEDTGRKSGEQQAWSAEQRNQLLSHVDDRAHDAIDDVGSDRQTAIKACRDRALVYVLCFTGVRGAEILADDGDDRRGRDGLRWADVSLEDNSIQVLGKSGKWDDRPLPEPAVPALERLRSVLTPSSEEWPVIPTLDYPTLVQTFAKGMTERGYDPGEVEALRQEMVNDGEASLIELLVEYDINPPALTTHGARTVLKRLTDKAGIDLDDKHGYLAPHGARRGVGEVLVRAYGHAEAARYLDNSEEIVREHYSHIEAGELADRAEAAFAEHGDDKPHTPQDESRTGDALVDSDSDAGSNPGRETDTR